MPNRAKFDPNLKPTLIAIDSGDETPFALEGDKTTGRLYVDALATISGTPDFNLAEVGGSALSLGQQLAAASLPIVLTAAQLSTLTPPAAITNYALESGGNLAGAATSLAIIDDWDESDRAKVNLIPAQAGITGGAGSVAANTPRFTLASDDPAVTALQIIDNFISGSRGLVTEDNSAAILANQTDGDQKTQIVDVGGEAVTVTGGKLDVNATLSGSGGGTSAVDDAAFAIAVDTGTPAMGLFDDTSVDSVDENDVGVLRMSGNRNLYVQIRDAAGNERGLNVDASGNIGITDAGGAITVDGTVAVTNAGLTELAAAINASSQMDVNLAASAVDVMLGTDFSSVFGTASLILATQADDIANTADGIQTTAFGYFFDGTTWDRMRGDSTNGLLVQLSATDNGVLDQIDTNTDFGVVVGGGTEATALRVTIANNSTGVLSVDDNGGALTVDNGGTFAVQVDGTALTALQLIDDTVFADDAAFTPATSKVNAIGALADDASSDSIDEGDIGIPRMSLDRALHVVDMPKATSVYAPSSDDSQAYENDSVSKASAGILWGFSGFSSRTTPQWIQFHNASSAPADTAVPEFIIYVPALGNFSWDGGRFGRYCDTGIYWCNSTTGATKTIGADDCYVTLMYS